MKSFKILSIIYLKRVFWYYKNFVNYIYFQRVFEKHCTSISQFLHANVVVQTKKELINILHINTYDNIGGAAMLANSLCHNLIRKGFSSKLLVSKKYSKHEYTAILKKKKSIKKLLISFFQIRNNWSDFFESSSLEILNLDSFKNADIIHFHNLHGKYFNPLLLPILSLSKPVVWTFHDTQELIYPCDKYEFCSLWKDDCQGCNYFDIKYFNEKKFLIWEKKKEIAKKSNFTIVCPSNWLKDKVENSIYENNEIELIYNGIDTNIFKNRRGIVNRKIMDLPDNKFIILFVAHGGISNPSKGGTYFSDVYNKLLYDPNFFFLCIGGDKTGYMNKNWLNLGYIKDQAKLASYYSLADLFVYPSLNDVFGLVVAESLACGTPVITFRTGGIPEIVEHMKTGYIAPQGDIDELLNGIMTFYNNKELRDKVQIDGPSIVKQKFSIDVMTNNYIKLYEKTIKEFNNRNNRNLEWQ